MSTKLCYEESFKTQRWCLEWEKAKYVARWIFKEYAKLMRPTGQGQQLGVMKLWTKAARCTDHLYRNTWTLLDCLELSWHIVHVNLAVDVVDTSVRLPFRILKHVIKILAHTEVVVTVATGMIQRKRKFHLQLWTCPCLLSLWHTTLTSKAQLQLRSTTRNCQSWLRKYSSCF